MSFFFQTPKLTLLEEQLIISPDQDSEERVLCYLEYKTKM